MTPQPRFTAGADVDIRAEGSRLPVPGTTAPDHRSYPFSAVVGSDDMALALVLSTVSPEVGGVLVRGEKGTAKTTTVRALARVLPAVAVVPGCRFSCDPADPDPGCPDGPHPDATGETRPARLVELPVGATEDRVIGSLDLQQALGAGRVTYEPGLLAAAHRGLLYVDEVNLLHDHLVDLLLDAAATGRSTVEREGVSIAHASRMVLIGTMNPEEGELRPQLLDRFGLTAEVAAPRDPALRAEVVRRRMAFDRDPAAFTAGYAEAEAALSTRLATARALVDGGRADRRAAAAHRRGLRRVRGGRHARRPGDRPGCRRPRRLARADLRHPGRHPRRRPAGPAAPPPPQPLRRPWPGRGPARPAPRRGRARAGPRAGGPSRGRRGPRHRRRRRRPAPRRPRTTPADPSPPTPAARAAHPSPRRPPPRRPSRPPNPDQHRTARRPPSSRPPSARPVRPTGPGCSPRRAWARARPAGAAGP